ncbi:MAG: DUF1491 family protein [Pseudomonadota bacterium]
MTPRLAARVWIDAYIKRLDIEMIPAHIARKGDATAGAVLVKLATMDGQARLFQRSFDLMTGARTWVVLAEGAEAEVEEAARRQATFDPDLWVVEVEDPKGRHMLDDPGLQA